MGGIGNDAAQRRWTKSVADDIIRDDCFGDKYNMASPRDDHILEDRSATTTSAMPFRTECFSDDIISDGCISDDRILDGRISDGVRAMRGGPSLQAQPQARRAMHPG
jgi:hypothetical protein